MNTVDIQVGGLYRFYPKTTTILLLKPSKEEQLIKTQPHIQYPTLETAGWFFIILNPNVRIIVEITKKKLFEVNDRDTLYFGFEPINKAELGSILQLYVLEHKVLPTPQHNFTVNLLNAIEFNRCLTKTFPSKQFGECGVSLPYDVETNRFELYNLMQSGNEEQDIDLITDRF